MVRTIIFIIILFNSSLISQEICNDAIDNDNDGLVDINDPDCICESFNVSSLIPNPSFEEMNCCPTQEGELNCAVSWIQASAATTDYVHTCGVLGNTFLGFEAPLPFPDGQGGIGFRDGKPFNPNFKEYTGACLLEELKSGREYILDMFVGFHELPSSRYLKMAVFATDECNNLPFGQNVSSFGCPTNGQGWTQIGELEVSGANEWVHVSYSFTPDKDYSAIVIGPGCEPHPNYDQDPYFYFDKLTLAESAAFQIPIANVVGDICSDHLSLIMDDVDDYNYQWYLNGIALVGETQNYLDVTTDDALGNYQVQILWSDGCLISESYNHQDIPIIEEFINVDICKDESYVFFDDTITITGVYEQYVKIDNDCDSLYVLNLWIHDDYFIERDDTICSGSIYTWNSFETNEPGRYEFYDKTIDGCDSTTIINLEFLSTVENLLLQEVIEIDLGKKIVLSPLQHSSDIVSFTWFDEYNNIISDQLSTDELLVTQNTFFDLEVANLNGCLSRARTNIKVTADPKIYIPNVFTPNSQASNQKFIIGYNEAVHHIKSLRIYDRWGEMVFEYEGLIDDFQGWDGHFANSTNTNTLALQGVYTFHLIVTLLNNEDLHFANDVLLLR